MDRTKTKDKDDEDWLARAAVGPMFLGQSSLGDVVVVRANAGQTWVNVREEHLMKILVSAKRVTDPYTTLTLKKDGSGLDLEDVDYKMNPFCEIAVEEALRILDEVDDGEVVAISIGNDEAEREIRQALAYGGRPWDSR